MDPHGKDIIVTGIELPDGSGFRNLHVLAANLHLVYQPVDGHV